AQKEKHLFDLCSGSIIGAHAITEPDSGSDAFSMRTRAVKKNDRYILNGSKVFISNGPIADLFIIYARTDKEQGTLGGYSAFLVPKSTPGFSTGRPIEKMGLRTAPLCEVYFDDCELSPDQLLGKEGQGFSIFNYVMKWEVLCSFAVNIGEMERLIGKCIEYSKMRTQFGQSIGKYQAISHKIVNMKIGLESSRALLYQAGQKMLQGKNITTDIALAKIVTSESYVQTALDAIQVFGAYGYMHESGIEHFLRNAVAGKIYSGTSEIQRNTVATMMGL
ncbi:MAG: acyl-CoA dehydrogenase, partial [Desulfobacteraceae bacterium]